MGLHAYHSSLRMYCKFMMIMLLVFVGVFVDDAYKSKQHILSFYFIPIIA